MKRSEIWKQFWAEGKFDNRLPLTAEQKEKKDISLKIAGCKKQFKGMKAQKKGEYE